MPRFVESKKMTAHIVLLDGEFSYIFDLVLNNYVIRRDGARVWVELEGFPQEQPVKKEGT